MAQNYAQRSPGCSGSPFCSFCARSRPWTYYNADQKYSQHTQRNDQKFLFFLWFQAGPPFLSVSNIILLFVKNNTINLRIFPLFAPVVLLFEENPYKIEDNKKTKGMIRSATKIPSSLSADHVGPNHLPQPYVLRAYGWDGHRQRWLHRTQIHRFL